MINKAMKMIWKPLRIALRLLPFSRAREEVPGLMALV